MCGNIKMWSIIIHMENEYDLEIFFCKVGFYSAKFSSLKTYFLVHIYCGKSSIFCKQFHYWLGSWSMQWYLKQLDHSRCAYYDISLPGYGRLLHCSLSCDWKPCGNETSIWALAKARSSCRLWWLLFQKLLTFTRQLHWLCVVIIQNVNSS